MVLVGRVIVGAERDGEDIAAAVMDAFQEFGFRSALFPMGFYVDQATVFEAETGNVDGIGMGVLGETAAAGDIAAGEAPIGLDPGKR